MSEEPIPELAAAEPLAFVEKYLRCPRCPSQELSPEPGDLGELGCPECGGTYLPNAGIERLARDYLSLEPRQLRSLQTFVPKRALACCNCGESMSLLTLRGTPLDYCATCSGLWLDGGELRRVTSGKYGEPARDGSQSIRGSGPEVKGPPEVWTIPRLKPRPVATVAPPISSEDRRALLIGLVLAVLIPSFVLRLAGTFFHELGHTLASWSFGYPALGAFDLKYGGGFTSILERSTGIMLIIYGAFAVGLWRQRRKPRTLSLALALVAIYTMVVFTPLDELLILAFGHGMELLVAGICLVWTIAGRGTVRGKSLLAGFAIFTIWDNAILGWRLTSNTAFRQFYSTWGRPGGESDLSRIATEYLGITLSDVAAFLLLAALAMPGLSYFIYRYRLLMIERTKRWLSAGS